MTRINTLPTDTTSTSPVAATVQQGLALNEYLRGPNNQVLAPDVIQLSQAGLNAAAVSNDSVRVSSSIGKSQAVTSLSEQQARELYEEIARLI